MMPTMMSYKFGTLVLVPFPFTDQTTSKKRPAVVVSSEAYQAERPDLIIMAVTSRSRPATTVGEAPVTHWREAGLLKPSTFKPLVTTIEKKLVLKPLGQLAASDRKQLQTLLGAIFGLESGPL